VGGELFGVVRPAQFVDCGFGGGDLVQAPAIVDDLVGAGFLVDAYGLEFGHVFFFEFAEGFLFFRGQQQRVPGESMFICVFGRGFEPCITSGTRAESRVLLVRFYLFVPVAMDGFSSSIEVAADGVGNDLAGGGIWL